MQLFHRAQCPGAAWLAKLRRPNSDDNNIRSKDIAKMKGEDRRGVFLKEFHSLQGFRLRHVDEGKKDSPSKDYVHDVVALQIVGARWPARFDSQSNGHAILRLVDHDHSSSSMTTMLTRAKEMGGGLLARKIIPDKADEGGVVGTGHIPGFQVIDCTTGNIVSFASLSGSTSHGGQSLTPPEYVTLSYVWGQGPFEGPVQIKHPSGSRQQLSLPASLPLTISDTIQAVQRLGYRYLWIDRYCIPQDDLPAKQIQIKNMGHIVWLPRMNNETYTTRAGANQGIGYETAKNLVHSSADYHVILGSRDISKGEAAAQTLLQAEAGDSVKATKGTASSVPLDVTDETSIAAAVEHVATDFGRLDVLVNNAGIISTASPPTAQALRRVLETNVVGALAVTEAFLDLLRKA
ncbi:hypothetical protein QR685DRAFT_542700 [Neurospora intermedia]|uniref:Heterokaryon incompatibility domain-containing protein n=1 Tax=Neurospora intermedia TaxID=5142 RepID=A0ABR3DG69_NEUIN